VVISIRKSSGAVRPTEPRRVLKRPLGLFRGRYRISATAYQRKNTSNQAHHKASMRIYGLEGDIFP
jgi:hypothetical protein